MSDLVFLAVSIKHTRTDRRADSGRDVSLYKVSATIEERGNAAHQADNEWPSKDTTIRELRDEYTLHEALRVAAGYLNRIADLGE